MVNERQWDRGGIAVGHRVLMRCAVPRRLIEGSMEVVSGSAPRSGGVTSRPRSVDGLGTDERSDMTQHTKVSLRRRARVVLAGATIALPLAACVEEPPPPPWLAGGCLDSATTYPDLLYTGTPKVLNNVKIKGTLPSVASFSIDGSCSGDDTLFQYTLVRAANVLDAGLECDDVDPVLTPVVNLADPTYSYPAPLDAWLCQ